MAPKEGDIEVLVSLDKETRDVVCKLGYIPAGVYCTEPKNGYIPEHAEKNRAIIFNHVASLGNKN